MAWICQQRRRRIISYFATIFRKAMYLFQLDLALLRRLGMGFCTVVFAYQVLFSQLRKVLRCSLAVELDFERQAGLDNGGSVACSHD